MELDLKFSNFVIKPCVATGIMCICSYFIYNLCMQIHPGRIATIIALVFAVIIYAISVIILKIFNKEEIEQIPFGKKLYKILQNIGIYS